MSDAGYQGVADSNDSGGEFNPLWLVIEAALAKVQTAAVVQIKAVYPGGIGGPTTVDVQPMVSQIDGKGTGTAHGIIHGLPVMRMQAGATAIVIDPIVGDIGVAVFASRDISTVKNTNAAALPGSRRTHDWSDGIYVGGILGGTVTQYILANTSGITVHSPVTITIIAPTITMTGALNLTGDVAITGGLTTTGETDLGGVGGTLVKTVAGTATKVKAV